MFVDKAVIRVRGGHGGAGAVSFRREKGEPKGGPNGGDGGLGGSVIIVAEDGLTTLYDFRFQRDFFAAHGEPGGRKQCHGGDSPDLLVKVPPGTMVFNHETGELMHDIRSGDRVTVAQGGKGGFGNEHYKSSINQTPRKATPGYPGEEYEIRLELKLIADVGLVGMPNAGKSTLLAAMTRANPKIGDYPFTTLSPQLGIAEVDPKRRLVLADIPGLIEGAAQGAGLGHDFLRHIERTKMIVHLLDAAPLDGSNPAQNYRTIRGELQAYSQELADKPELIVLNKIDLLDDDERKQKMNELCEELELREGKDVLAISGAARENLKSLLDRLWRDVYPTVESVEGWS